MKSFIVILLFAWSWLLPALASAEEINAYTIDVTVKQSGELAVVETIDYDFGQEQKHGIFREIPVMVKRFGLEKNLGIHDFEVKMDDDSVSWKDSSIHDKQAGKMIRIKIGSAGSTVTGKHRYRISYLVDIGVLPMDDETQDSIRWNAVGVGWKVPIKNITANFYLPDTLSSSQIQLATFTGPYGSTRSDAQQRWIASRHLQVNVDKLYPYSGLTVELAYPANLLEQNGLSNMQRSVWDWVSDFWEWGALLGILGFFRWQLNTTRGFVDNRSVAVQYQPPQGFSLLQSGLVLDKYADSDDFSAAILELGHLGFLEIDKRQRDPIEPTDPDYDPDYNPEDDDKITVITRTKKRSDFLTKDQTYLLEKLLFADGDKFVLDPKNPTKIMEMVTGTMEVNRNLYGWLVEKGYMQESPEKTQRKFFWKGAMLVLVVLVFSYYKLKAEYDGETAMITLFLPIAFSGVGFAVLLMEESLSNKLVGLLFIAGGAVPFIFLDVSFWGVVIGPVGASVLAIAGFVYFYRQVGLFTAKGARAQKHLLGLKEYIKRVKQDELKRRLEVDPMHIEKLLPYAVLFDETDHWLSYIDTLQAPSPKWYKSDTNDLQDFPSSFHEASHFSSSSSSGGSSGGGSSSGGGGGGGGGGSW